MNSNERFEWPGRRLDDEAHDLLAAFLLMDIQRSPEWAQDLCEHLEAAREWQRVGNAYCLRIVGDVVELEDVMDDDDEVVRLPLAEVQVAAEAWRVLVSG